MFCSLFFRQRSFLISYNQTTGKYFLIIQCFNELIIVDLPFHIIVLFIIGKHEHGLGNNIHILILHASTIVTLIFFFSLFVVGNHYLTIVVHVLVGLLTGFIILRIIGSLLIRIYSVLFIQLCFQHLEFICISTFHIPYFPTRLRSVLISQQEIGIFIYHRRIIFNCPFIISCLIQQQTTVENSHHIVGLHFDNKIKVLNSPVVIADEIIGINIQCNIIVTHRSSQVILMVTGQSTVDINT